MKHSLAFLLVFTLLMGMFGGIQAGAADIGTNPDLPSVDLSKLGSANIPAVGTGSCWTYEKVSKKLSIHEGGVIIFQTDDAVFTGSIQISAVVSSVTFDNINVKAQGFNSAFSVQNTDIIITLKGNNILKGADEFSPFTALNANGSVLTIKGGGKLECNGGNSSNVAYRGADGVIAKSINVENGRLEAHGGKGPNRDKDGVAFSVGSNSNSVEELQKVLHEGGEPANEEHLLKLDENIFNSYKLAKAEQDGFEPTSQPYAFLEYFPESDDDDDDDDTDTDKNTSKTSTTTTIRRNREPTILPISLRRNFDETTLAAGQKYDFTIMGPERDTASYVYVSGGTIASRSGHNFTVVPSETAEVVKITITASGFNEITLEYDIEGGTYEPLFEPAL